MKGLKLCFNWQDRYIPVFLPSALTSSQGHTASMAIYETISSEKNPKTGGGTLSHQTNDKETTMKCVKKTETQPRHKPQL